MHGCWQIHASSHFEECIMVRWLVILAVVYGAVACWGVTVGAAEAAAGSPLPGWFAEDPGHIAAAVTAPAEDPANAIPQPPVTRQTYLAWCQRSGHLERDLTNRTHGVYGPRHALPSLAAYAATGDARYGESVKLMLQDFAKWLQEDTDKRGMNSQYMFEPECIGLELRVLRKGGVLTAADEGWVKEMILRLNRTVHVWETPETFWRGSMHRAQGEGVMKWLAAQWYPDAPEAAQWRAYSKAVWNDFWAYRDNPANDVNYYMGTLFPIVLGVEQMDRTPSGQTPKEFFTDPGMLRIWDRLAETITPDGAVVPFGPSAGWDSHPGQRIWMLEAAARWTGDGRYRFAAHRLMNYVLYQEKAFRSQHMMDGPYTTESIALAYFDADDMIKPVPMPAASTVLYHKETLRVNGKKGAAAYLEGLDPAADKAHICCNLLVTNQEKPFKLVLRSGWNPGDLYMLVDIFPRHEPMNVSGIIGLTRWGAPFTISPVSKAVTDVQNMTMVEDLSGTATPVTNPNPNTVDAYYQEVTVEPFIDRPLATYAMVNVTDYLGFNMTHHRTFYFIKNRFAVVKDVSDFKESFLARVGPVWRTQRLAAVGPNWADTYLENPVGAETVKLRAPSANLLVYHAAQPGAALDIAQFGKVGDPYAYAPLRERYAWQGVVQRGVPVHVTTVLLPHSPLQTGTALAAGIDVLLDTPAQSVLRLRAEPGRTEWIVLNPAGTPVQVEGLATNAKQVYLDLRDGKPTRAQALGGTFLTLDDKDVYRQAERKDWERE
jgi:hypothetical protein